MLDVSEGLGLAESMTFDLRMGRMSQNKVYFMSQMPVQQYWTILDHFCIPVL